LQYRTEVSNFAVLLWELGMLCPKHYHEKYSEVAISDLPIDPSWPEELQSLIKSCTSHETDAAMTMNLIVEELREIKQGKLSDI
jgi:hypothetical protein